VIWPAHTGTFRLASTSRTCVTNGDSVLSRRGGTALMTSANGFFDCRAKSIVSLTAARSNTASRTGMTTSVATLIASVTAPDMFGAVSTNAHSTPSALCLFDDLLDAAAHGVAQLRLGRAAQLVPERDRPLRIAVDQHAAPRRAISMGCQVRSQRALAGAALARGKKR
jgi:hypothetical protein